MTKAEQSAESRTKLLDASLQVIRGKGYAATRVEDVCAAAGLSKGSFFHHFKSKEELAVAAAEHWGLVTGGLFRSAAYRSLPDPVDRVLAYVELRKALMGGEIMEMTCLVGTMVQETYETHPAIREACEKTIWGHSALVQEDIAAALEHRGLSGEYSAESLALYAQAVVQGALILAKARHTPEVAVDCLDHLRRYLEQIFNSGRAKENE